MPSHMQDSRWLHLAMHDLQPEKLVACMNIGIIASVVYKVCPSMVG
jgi:hypothetical protein